MLSPWDALNAWLLVAMLLACYGMLEILQEVWRNRLSRHGPAVASSRPAPPAMPREEREPRYFLCTLVRGGEVYTWFYRDDQRPAFEAAVRRMAADCELSLSAEEAERVIASPPLLNPGIAFGANVFHTNHKAM